jgi:hypothetical protein
MTKPNNTAQRDQSRAQAPLRSIDAELRKISEDAAPGSFLEKVRYWQREGLDAPTFAYALVMDMLARIQKLSLQIEEAFAGQLFLPNLAPDAPANRRRTEACLAEHNRVAKLLGDIIGLMIPLNRIARATTDSAPESQKGG